MRTFGSALEPNSSYGQSLRSPDILTPKFLKELLRTDSLTL